MEWGLACFRQLGVVMFESGSRQQVLRNGVWAVSGSKPDPAPRSILPPQQINPPPPPLPTAHAHPYKPPSPDDGSPLARPPSHGQPPPNKTEPANSLDGARLPKICSTQSGTAPRNSPPQLRPSTPSPPRPEPVHGPPKHTKQPLNPFQPRPFRDPSFNHHTSTNPSFPKKSPPPPQSPDGDIFVTRAPGRLDVMGGIADYSGSLVLQVGCFCMLCAVSSFWGAFEPCRPRCLPPWLNNTSAVLNPTPQRRCCYCRAGWPGSASSPAAAAAATPAAALGRVPKNPPKPQPPQKPGSTLPYPRHPPHPRTPQAAPFNPPKPLIPRLPIPQPPPKPLTPPN